MTMVEDIGVMQGPLAERLADYASDAQRYVTVTAKTSGINALVNLIFLVVMGVDTPVVWSFLYFFLNFIPTLRIHARARAADCRDPPHVWLEESPAGCLRPHSPPT